MSQLTVHQAWTVSGFRWIGEVFIAIAERLERHLDRSPVYTSHEPHFDGDTYLSDLRNKVYTHYY